MIVNQIDIEDVLKKVNIQIYRTISSNDYYIEENRNKELSDS